MFIHRTRLFDERWTVVQQWTSANISWITGYLKTKFQIIVKKSGLVVIVLTQVGVLLLSHEWPVIKIDFYFSWMSATS